MSVLTYMSSWINRSSENLWKLHKSVVYKHIHNQDNTLHTQATKNSPFLLLYLVNHMGFIIRVWWRRSLSLTDLGRSVSFFSRECFVDSFWIQLTFYVLSTFQCLSTWVWVAKVNLNSRRRLPLPLFDCPASFPQLFKIERDSRLWTRTLRLVSFRWLLVRLFRSFFRWHHSNLFSFLSVLVYEIF